MPREAKRRLHDGPHLVREEARSGIEAGQFLAVVLLQIRLVVPRIHLAGPAVHEEPDNIPGACGEVALAGRHGVRRGASLVALQEGGKGKQTGAGAGDSQKLAPRAVDGVGLHGLHRDHFE